MITRGMMEAGHNNAFHITGHMWGESPGTLYSNKQLPVIWNGMQLMWHRFHVIGRAIENCEQGPISLHCLRSREHYFIQWDMTLHMWRENLTGDNK